jgi:hypothetical protein
MEQVMSYLDLSPMIAALRTRPCDFEMQQGWLHHIPSRHRFKVDREGSVRVEARCDCAMLAVRREQGRELWDAFQQWHSGYWRAVEINKEFASHFRAPTIWRRLCRQLVRRMRRMFRVTSSEGSVSSRRTKWSPPSNAGGVSASARSIRVLN